MKANSEVLLYIDKDHEKAQEYAKEARLVGFENVRVIMHGGLWKVTSDEPKRKPRTRRKP